MNNESEINPKRDSMRDLLSTSYFKIPIFQRSYSWSLEHWQDFWDDLTIHMDKNHDFFMGSIVLKDLKSDAKFEIIDGQQRLTTSIILLAVIRDYFKSQGNKEARKIHAFIEDDVFGRNKQPKIKLNKYDNSFFQSNIINYSNTMNSVKNRGLNEGQRNIFKAYNFFRKMIEESKIKVDLIARNLLDKTYVISIVVDDVLQAYTVFETLNSRGKDLTAADLIKNSVLSKASEEDILLDISDAWDRIFNNLSNYSITVFIKYYLTIQNGAPVREKELFKKIKSSGVIEKNLEEFIKELEIASETYIKILEPSVSFWNDKEIPNILNGIKIMGLRTCYPFLLSIALSDHKIKTKKDLFLEVEKLGFRYNIIMNNNPNELEVKYADWAEKLNLGTITINELKKEINQIKPVDEDFYKSFLEKRITENKLAQYILKKVGNHIQGDELFSFVDNLSVEHIIPQKFSSWKTYIEQNNDLQLNGEIVKVEEFTENLIYRLGNQTLLLPKDNNKIGDDSFEQKKKKIYCKSEFKLNKEIANESKWSLDEINKFQEKLAQNAKEIW